MPLSLCFALSVAMGNLSLKYIYPSFNQMLGPALTPSWAVVVTSRPELEQADKQPRIHVTADHSTPGRGDAAEALSAENVAVHAGHLCWACSLQREGGWAKIMCLMALRSSLISSHMLWSTLGC